MGRRMIGGLLALILFFGGLAAAETPAGEEAVTGLPGATGTPAGEESTMGLPAVIDRWTDPAAWPGFSFEEGEDLLEIWFPRIRDRDAAILRYQDQVWMIDCSDKQAEERVVPLLKALRITEIQRIVNTHPHPDHINGLYAVNAACPVGELLICFPEDANEYMVRAVEYCRAQGIPVTSYGDEEILCMGDGLVRLQCWMKLPEKENMNNRSAQIKLTYGMRSMLFMADLESGGHAQLLAAMDPERLRADILRYPHHGKDALKAELFEAISPELVVITSSANVREVVNSTRFLTYRHIPTAHTTGGYLHLVTDGETWLAEKVADSTLFDGLEGVSAPVMRVHTDADE